MGTDKDNATGRILLYHSGHHFWSFGMTFGLVSVLISVSLMTTPCDMVSQEAIDHGIDPAIIKAMIQIESGGDPEAVGDDGESIGLMQIQPRYHGWRLAEGESLKDPRVNVRIGCEILQDLLYKSHGDVGAALTVYNAGYDTGDRSYYYKVMEEMK